MKKVMCAGTFDILHKGHLNYFEQAREFGDFLIVVVARDSSAKKEGKELLHNQEQRLAEVAKHADRAIIGNEGDRLKIVEIEKPDVIVLGYDQKIDEKKLTQELKKRGLQPKIIRAKAYYPEKYKSSIIKLNFVK